MLKQEIHYTDFDGNQQVAIEFFSLTRTEVMKWEIEASTFSSDGENILSTSGGIEDQIRQIVASGKGSHIIAFVDQMLERAYGVREGNRFVKSPELFKEFTQTAQYDQLYMDLCTKADLQVKFLRGIMPFEDSDKPSAPPTVQAPLPQRVPGEAFGAAQQPEVYGTPSGEVVSKTVGEMSAEELRQYISDRKIQL